MSEQHIGCQCMSCLGDQAQSLLKHRYNNLLSLLTKPWYMHGPVLERGLDWVRLLGTDAFSDQVNFNVENRQTPVESAIGGRPDGNNAIDKMLRFAGVRITSGGTAIVPVEGVLAKKMSHFGVSEQGTSTDLLADVFEVLIDDDRARQVVLDIDSPGGSVEGVELASQSLSQLNSWKPTEAIVNELMASGALYLGSQVSKITIPKAGIAGSLGVYTVRMDATKFNEDRGVDFHIIRAGAHKAEGHPFLEMSDGEFERIQNRVNQFYDQFKHAVMVGRGLKQEDVDSMADGTIEVGEKAIERGFADEIGSLKGVVRRLDKSKTFTTGGGQSMALFSKDKAEKKDDADQAGSESQQAASEMEQARAQLSAERKALEKEKQELANERALAKIGHAESVLAALRKDMKITPVFEQDTLAVLSVLYRQNVLVEVDDKDADASKASHSKVEKQAADVMLNAIKGLSSLVPKGALTEPEEDGQLPVNGTVGEFDKAIRSYMEKTGIEDPGEAYNQMSAKGLL